MTSQHINFTIKDYGYTVISRVENVLRTEIGSKLKENFGEQWVNEVPKGIWEKYFERSGNSVMEDCSNVEDFLDETDLTDIYEIISYKKNNKKYYPELDSNELKRFFDRVYPIRCQIAHIKSSFSHMEYEVLLELSRELCSLLNMKASELSEFLDKITKPNSDLFIKTPPSFLCDFSLNEICLNNLPDSDYAPDGGFVGRSKDLTKLTKLIKNKLDRVVTVVGAGGVGKSAIAHKVCDYFIIQERTFFDAVIWVSAKEEYLTISGIEKVEPSFHNYEGLLDSILETYNLNSDESSLEDKENDVELIFNTNEKGILLVIDNLETIKDETVLDYIKDIPLPNKVLITSRLGLGEIERRLPLKELEELDAVKLVRVIAQEKGVDSLAKQPDKILKKYVSKMFRYPLAIKWTIGQVALGVDINVAIKKLDAATSDLVKFCFEYIFNESLKDNEKYILYAMSLYEDSVSRGILSHVTNLETHQIDESIRKLVVASLVIPIQENQVDRQSLETKYDLLPLTRSYVQAELRKNAVLLRTLSERKNSTEHLVNEGERAGHEYIYSLSSYGASTEEEKIAVTMSMNAYRYYSQDKNYDKASLEFDKAAQIAPEFAVIYRNWASLEAECELYDRADILMQKATMIDPDDPRLWFTWGNIKKKEQQYSSASEYLKKALELSPDDGAIFGMLGEVEKRLGNFKDAESFLLKAIELGQNQRDDTRNEVVNKTVLSDVYRRWSEEVDDNEEAESLLIMSLEVAQEAFSLNNSDQRAEYRYKEVNLKIAMFYYSENKKIESKEYFNEAISLRTESNKFKNINIRAYYYLAHIAYKDNDKKISAKYLDEGKKYFSGNVFEHKYDSLDRILNGEIEHGVVEYTVTDKAYGFIEPENKKYNKMFFHMNGLEKNITITEFDQLAGKRVSFLPVEKMKNGHMQLEAVSVEVLGLPAGVKTGVVKRIILGKGYGFITSDDGDYFMHHENLIGNMSITYFESLEGAKVKFTPKQNLNESDKLAATNINVISLL